MTYNAQPMNDLYRFTQMDLGLAMFMALAMLLVNPIYMILFIFLLYPWLKERSLTVIPFVFFIFLAIASRETGVTFSDMVGDDAIEYYRRFNYLARDEGYIYSVFINFFNMPLNNELFWYLLNYPATFFTKNIDDFRFYNYILLGVATILLLRKEPRHALSIFFLAIFFFAETVYLFSHLWRQAWAAIFLVYAIYAYSGKKTGLFFLFSFLALFSHLSVLPILLILFTTFLVPQSSQRKTLTVYFFILFFLVNLLVLLSSLLGKEFPRVGYFTIFDSSRISLSDLLKLFLILSFSSWILIKIYLKNKQVSSLLFSFFIVLFFVSIFSLLFSAVSHRYLTLIAIPLAFFIVLFLYENFTLYSARLLVFVFSLIGLLRVLITEPGFFPLFFEGDFFSVSGIIFR